ncbi:MAG: hypothetical protein CM15mP32_1180 [Flavobacteriaceae bacterium]|nr:MAG: hypothetical protein CM15mP32_1180 [Flavobacteriaceae bacterium]
MDRTISQSNKNYLNNLVTYHRILQQRNALLKHFSSTNSFDKDTLSTYNEKLVQFGNPIHEARKTFIKTFHPLFHNRYQFISGNHEPVSVSYDSKLDGHSFETLLENHCKKIVCCNTPVLAHTKTICIFKSMIFRSRNLVVKGRKTFLIALKLAQFDIIRNQMNVLPILLLDDIFDKLDDSRVMQIINLVNEDSFGQLFVTDTNKERTENMIKETAQSYSIFNL